jgi:hypothetical protein
MIGRGQWDSNSYSLYVRFQQADWHIVIRRCDGKPCDRLRSYDGHDVSADALKELLPNWGSLTWQPAPTFCHALFATDGDFKVRLLATKESSRSDCQIIKEFEGFMIDSLKTRSPQAGVAQ